MNVSWSLDTTIKGGPVHDADSFHVAALFTQECDALPLGYGNIFLGPSELIVKDMTRLAHCNAAERGTVAGDAAMQAVKEWFSNHFPDNRIPLVPLGRDKYKRLLCDVVLEDGSKLSDYVLGLAGSVPMNLAKQLAA